MICVGPAGGVICPVLKLFNIAVFSDTVNVMNIKLCMMVLLTELCLFIPLSMTLTVFQGHSCVKQFQLNFFFFFPFKRDVLFSMARKAQACLWS